MRRIQGIQVPQRFIMLLNQKNSSFVGDNLVSMLLKPSYTTQDSEKVSFEKDLPVNFSFRQKQLKGYHEFSEAGSLCDEVTLISSLASVYKLRGSCLNLCSTCLAYVTKAKLSLIC